ncbi:hypothetical protein CLV48_11926 [Cecembia rubra]|uniref:Uncharacterized protein n=1 Tax=Cecembia rubra TaxID=1485585 RepID=A0A2P8DMA4_9BACT|nr:hypothetical protein CLV48_11926 [Cecembia rubra]
MQLCIHGTMEYFDAKMIGLSTGVRNAGQGLEAAKFY